MFATKFKCKTETPTDKAKRFCLSDDKPKGFELVWVNDFIGIEKINNILYIDFTKLRCHLLFDFFIMAFCTYSYFDICY